MAKKKTETPEDTTQLDAWKAKHEIKGDDADSQFKAVKLVRDRQKDSETGLETNCYWDSYSDSSSDTTTASGSWFARWDKQEKAALMWYRQPSSSQFQSNIKSPMIRGRVSTFVNQFKRLNLAWDARPNNEADINSSLIARKVMDYWYSKSSAKTELNLVAEEMAIHGSAYFRTHYVTQEQEFSLVKTKPTDTKKNKKDKTETDKEAEAINAGKTIFDTPTKQTVIDDVVLEYVPLRELFVDPQARCIHGVSYSARWVVRRRFVHLDDFKTMFENNPDAMNVDKVKGTSSYSDDNYTFFRPPEGTISKNLVELLEMEDSSDRLVVVANDLLIIDQPLPWNHKEISYHKVDFIKNPGQFFGIGLADLLLNIQGSMEILMNMAADYIFKTYNYRIAVDAKSYGELKKLWNSDSVIIPVNTIDGQGIDQKIRPIQNSQIGFDLFQLMDILERNATMATQIDPSQMALNQNGRTATSSVLNKEQLQAMIGGVIENIVNDGLIPAGRQVWKLMQQYYSIPKVEEITGNDQKKKSVEKYRTIRLEGIELKLNEDTQLLTEQETENIYSFFEVSNKYLNTKEEIDILIRPDSKEVPSKSLDRDNAQKLFAQMAPYAVDPNNIQAIQQHPLPMVNAPKLFEWVFGTSDAPQDLLINKKENEEIAQKTAFDHLTRILSGETVAGKPGQSELHRKLEVEALLSIDAKIKEIGEAMAEDVDQQTQKIMAEVSKQPVTFDPATGQPIMPAIPPQPEPSIELQRKMNDLEKARERLAQHVEIESLPAAFAMQAPPKPQDNQAPQGGLPAAPPMPGGSNEGSGPVPMPGDPSLQAAMPGMNGVPQG